MDFAVEFPVTTAQTLRAVARIAGDRGRFGVSLVMLSLVADHGHCRRLGLLRFDLWPTALAAIGVAAWRRERPALASVGLVAGGAFKLWPLMFLPLLLVSSEPRRRVAPIATAMAAGLAVAAEWLWVAGPSGLYQVLTFRAARGWEIESTVGTAWMLFDRSAMRVDSGAWRIGTMIGPTAILLSVLGAAPCLWLIWRGARTGHLGAGWAGGISVLLVTSALLSAQFGIWLTPASGIAWVEKDRRIAVLTGLAVFFTNLVFKSFHPLTLGAPMAIATVLARNLLFAALALDAARRLTRAPVRD